LPADRFQVASVESLPFANSFFDHIICSAVLHFAESNQQFNAMLSEMTRLLKPGGSLFIRMTSNIGIENMVIEVSDGVYKIPDGSTRFLLTKSMLKKLLIQYRFILIEPLKTVNVEDTRCMTTLLLKKDYQ
jgi:ubiquinone/menaquinone biosynthesis C-methylase UbiE